MTKFKLLALILIIFSPNVFAQNHFEKMWDKRYGGNAQDFVSSFKKTTDGGYVFGGWSNSGISGEKSENCRGLYDYWMVKVDSAGNKEWDKRFGGSLQESIYEITPTTDGGYILGGNSYSDSSFDKSEPSRGMSDYWIVKTDSVGNKIWDKRFGGTYNDVCTSIKQLPNGTYLALGYSYSDNTGDKSVANYGTPNNSTDGWLLNIDANGTKIWDKRFGSYSNEYMFSITITSDSAVMLGGFTNSNLSNDISQTGRGGYDYWIVKIDFSGNKIWDRRFGGTNDEYYYSLTETSDQGFALFGASKSGIGGDKTTSLLGYTDFWVTKLDDNGNLVWDKSYGGSGSEWAGGMPYREGNIIETSDGGLLFGATSNSPASGTKSESNLYFGQNWVVKTNDVGDKQWDKTLHIQGLGDAVYPLEANDGCFVFANYAWADTGAYKTSELLGFADIWLLKLCNCQAPPMPYAQFASSAPTICKNNCIQYVTFSDCFDSCQWFFPGGIPSTSTHFTPYVCYPDTGDYDATLVIMNANGSDTLYWPNYVHVQIPVPTITSNGDTIFASPANTYQWYDDAGLMLFEELPYLVPLYSGYFYVCVTDSLGCTACSDSIYFDPTALSELPANQNTISIKSNAVASTLEITSRESGEICFYDLTGKMIARQQITSGFTTFDTSTLSQGFYLLKFENGRTTKVFKVAVQH